MRPASDAQGQRVPSHHDPDHDHAARDPHALSHDHDHGPGHSHVAAGTDEWRILGAFLIIFVFMLVEIVGGLLSGSLALLADGGHMISDAAALAMSWGALRIGRRPADGMRSYGYRRLEVLVAFVNGCALFLIAAWVIIEAMRRFRTPVEVLGGPMLAVAVAGLVANAVAFWLLSGGNRENLSMRSAWLHVLGDLLGFAIAIIAAGVILFTGWSPIDPLLSVAVALLILRSAASIVRSSAHILLEGTPLGFDSEALRRDLLTSLPSVVEVHHIHAWSLTQEQPLVTLHVRCAEGADRDTVVIAVGQRLRRQFGITHATIQIDHAVCADEYCAEAPRRSSTG
jgi:cobalt-zinc-cadmium efflux system protein